MEKLVKQIIGRSPVLKIMSWPNNRGLKLISLIFAILIWYFVVGEDKVDTTIFIPVEIVNLPRDLVISNQFKKQLEVTVSGPRGLINGISRQRITRTVNLAKAVPGALVVRNEPQTIQFPRGITVSRIQPTHLTFIIDELLEKDLQIRGKVTGEPAAGYELAGVFFEPQIIRISGPKSVLGREKQLIAKPVDISGLDSSVSLQTNLDLRPALLELMGENAVTAKVVIREKTVERTVSDVPVRISGIGPGKKPGLEPEKVSIRAMLPLSTRGNPAGLFEATVAIDGLPPGTHKIQVKVTAPEQIKVIETVPATVNVRLGR